MPASSPTPGGTGADRDGGEYDAEGNEPTKPGPPDPQHADLDAPSPPGSPMRQDSPSGSAAPGGPQSPGRPPATEVPDEQRPMRPVHEPGEDVDPARPVLEGEDNAQSSQDEPSDDIGHD